MADWEESKGSTGVATDGVFVGRTVVIGGAESDGHTLPKLFRAFVTRVLNVGDATKPAPPLLHRIRCAMAEASPRLGEASKNSACHLHKWARSGSPLRALLVISIGSVMLISLTAVSVFMFFLLAATANAVIISFLVSLAAAGGFLALFFTSLAAIYVGAVSTVFLVVSFITISAIIGVMIISGWAGFFLAVWLVAAKALDLTKRSLTSTSSAIVAFSAARQTHKDKVSKDSD